ncbi:MAG: hypothetical protein AAF889_00025 [Cyanobacteria bacterium P01_D01_bin.73]
MPRTLTMPANKAMKLAPDCWETVIEAALKKGVNPRAVVEGVIRTQTDAWVSGAPSVPNTPAIAAAPSEPFDAGKALDSLFD